MVPDLNIPIDAVTFEDSTCWSCNNRLNSRRTFRVNRCNSADKSVGSISAMALIMLVYGIVSK